MQYNEIYNYEEAKDKILSGLNKISNPVIDTLSPKGRNVIFTDSSGNTAISNDGYTIVNNIKLKDEVENTIAELIKFSSIKTNQMAGDGTSTSILLSKTLITEGFKLIDKGMNPMILKKSIERASEGIVKAIEDQAIEIKDNKELHYVATISANNDTKVADKVVEAVAHAGESGQVILEYNNKPIVEVEKETGFMLPFGMFSEHYKNQQGKIMSEYRDVKVLITNRKLYYEEEEAIAIIAAIKKAGFKDVVIIAKDFIGRAVNSFLENHQKGILNILPIKLKVSNDNLFNDLAAYLGTKILTDKEGKLTESLTIDHFGTIKRIISHMNYSLIVPDKKHNSIDDRVKELLEEKEDDKTDNEKELLDNRIANLTNGLVTIKIGAKTQLESRETYYRFQDSLAATRCAKELGYVIGGGLTLTNAYSLANANGDIPEDVSTLMNYVCSSPVMQIIKNCGTTHKEIMSNVHETNIKDSCVGYNALTGQYENLLKAGVIEPLKVAVESFKNAVSVSTLILSSGHIITTKIDEETNVGKKEE